jgi:hypothetical protein
MSKDKVATNSRYSLEAKKHLVGLGYDPELIRLFGLWMRWPRNEVREKRFYEYLNNPPYKPEQLSLF